MAALAAALKKSAPLPRVRAVVCDWDGTVVKTMPAKIANAAFLFSEHFRADPKEVAQSYRKYSGISRKELFEMIARENIGRELSTLEFNRLSGEFTRLNLESYAEKKVFSEANLSVLKRLKDKNLLLFISSSAAKDEIDKLAESLGIRGFFQEILGALGNFKKGKPHLDYIRDKYGLKLTEILFVGDEEADMRLASRIGVRCVGIGGGRQTVLKGSFADYVIDDLSEMIDLITHV